MSKRDQEQNLDFLAPDDNLYDPMQEEMNKQLLQTEEQLELQYQQIKIKRQSIQKEKEEVGVRLYTAQQQLASNQMDYQKAHDNFNIAQRLRIESDQKLHQVNQIYQTKKEETVVLQNKMSKAQKELENLMKHYHEIEAYNVQLKSDIAVTKIETFTAEGNVANLEKIKQKQDLLIDSMNEESKRLEEQKNILAAQIISQREETDEAKKILKQAQAEMQKVIAGKKNLLDRWEKSIMMMQKRDSTVETLQKRLHDQREKNALLINQLSGLRTEIRKEEELTEKLGAQGNMIGKIKANLEQRKIELTDLRDKVSAQLFSLKDSMAKTQLGIKAASLEKKSVQDAMKLIQANIMKLHTETKRLLQKLIEQKSEHTTIEKTASNLLKQAHRIQLDTQEKEIQLQNLLNEIARVKIDQLNTKSQIELLQREKEQKLAEQQNKNYLAITYDVQIKQGHDINEKKQHEVGRLNKVHDMLMSKANDDGKNSEENKLINLVRETDQLEEKCNELYRQWIKKQTALVHENINLQQLKERVTNLQNKKTIMEQKKSRLNGNFQAREKEIAQITINLKGLQQQMNKLNDTIAVNSDKKQKLENENVNLHSEFIEKLKQMEREAVRLEINIDRIRQEKAELMNEIVECERQIMLWERKYQLQQAMQETLDPNVGQSEIEQLKRELHRMQLRYNSLLKEQQKIKTEAHRAIIKKADIELKYTASKKKETSKKKDPQTSNQLKQALRVTKDNEAKVMKSLQETEKKLQQKQNELQQVAQALQQANENYKHIENDNHQLQTQTILTKIKKNIDVLRISTLQKKYKKLGEIESKTAKLMYSEPILQEKLIEVKEKNGKLLDAVEQISQKYIQYSDLFTPLLQVHQVTRNVLE